MRTGHQRTERVELVALAVVLTASMTIAGCEEETITVGRGGARRADAGAGATAAAAPSGPVTPLSYRDEDFVEAETNRDPFRSYAQAFVTRPTRTEIVQRDVIMRGTAIEEMRLIAIVSGVANPSAMLVDRDGTGYTVHRGDWLGRAEVVQTGGEDAVPITLNWRVDRIRSGEVVLTREDPTAPNRPPLTRVIPLHENEEETAPI
jgi:type IV pilus assembly protein PilP